MTNAPKISYREAKYLKHVGSLMDVKVTISTLNDEVKIFIRDREFSDGQRARRYLQQIAEHEPRWTPEDMIEVAS